jgi:hypothetical protein
VQKSRSQIQLAGFTREITTGTDGSFRFTNVPFNPYHKEALYNFLSTFSGTHFVSPRSVTGELGFHF